MKNELFQKKINRAREVEREILKWYRKNIDKDAKLPIYHHKGYDIISNVGNVEVKEDRYAHQSQNYAIEFRDASGEPSGIEATTAKHFVLVDWEYVVFTLTDNLKFLVKNYDRKKAVKMGYKTKEGKQATGWLIPRDVILNSPLVRVEKRWF